MLVVAGSLTCERKTSRSRPRSKLSTLDTCACAGVAARRPPKSPAAPAIACRRCIMTTPYPQMVQRIEIDANTYSYSQGVLVEDASKLLFVSGQIPASADGTVPSTFAAQCRLAWANVLDV